MNFHFDNIFYFGKWLLISALIAVCVGSASAGFLYTLDRVTDYREDHTSIIYFLPVAGFFIALIYAYWGKAVLSGNNLIIENIQNPQRRIPLIMAPFIYFSTLVTHLFGGSAGREGTALQMAASIVDQFSIPLKLSNDDRKVLLISAVAAGFGAVFGTPLAGAIFAMEFFVIGKIKYNAIYPAFISSILADFVVKLWAVPHTQYRVDMVPDLSLNTILFALLSGVLFGLCALIFSIFLHKYSAFIKAKVKNELLRPVLGGVIVIIGILLLGNTRYIGLGIPVIVSSFREVEPWYSFLLKIIFTVLTIGTGFKGGEVTPLFFIGATLGSALGYILPLPVSLLAGMGFVAVFAGATNTPLACMVMGMELFGAQGAIYFSLAVMTSYIFSGKSSIYSSQIIGEPKNNKNPKIKYTKIGDYL